MERVLGREETTVSLREGKGGVLYCSVIFWREIECLSSIGVNGCLKSSLYIKDKTCNLIQAFN